MNDRLLVGVLHSLAHLDEQRQPLAHAQTVLVTIVGDRHAWRVLHDEIRPSFRSGTGIKDPGDGRVLHQGQGLPLRLEARHQSLGVHAGLDELEGDGAVYGRGLLGLPDFGHATFADFLQQPVRTNRARRDGRRERPFLGQRGGFLEKITHPLLPGEGLGDFALQFAVALAGKADITFALVRGLPESRRDNRRDPVVEVRAVSHH